MSDMYMRFCTVQDELKSHLKAFNDNFEGATKSHELVLVGAKMQRDLFDLIEEMLETLKLFDYVTDASDVLEIIKKETLKKQ